MNGLLVYLNADVSELIKNRLEYVMHLVIKKHAYVLSTIHGHDCYRMRYNVDINHLFYSYYKKSSEKMPNTDTENVLHYYLYIFP